MNNKYKIHLNEIKYIKKEKIKKPTWVKIKLPIDSKKITKIKKIIKNNNLHTVCEEASCPNIHKCFNKGTATFMILGSICTRRCPFCDVCHGRPKNPDLQEPKNLSKAINLMKINYVVITSVNRDDLKDGGANHFSESIKEIRKNNKNIKIEILVPDFKKCMNTAISILNKNPPDVFSHNIETVPRIYNKVKPGANYKTSLQLLKTFKQKNPKIPTKSGILLGLGESDEEVLEVMADLQENGVNILTIGQYLQPSKKHLPVKRYVKYNTFNKLKRIAKKIGFINAKCGTFVRSSFQANKQIKNLIN